MGTNRNDSLLWTSVAVVYRECLVKRSGEQLPHVARRIDSFLDDRTPTCTLSAVYERTKSLHCMKLLDNRRPAIDALYREWEFAGVVAQAAKRGDLEALAWLANTYMADGCLTSAASAAATSGELEILKWLHEQHTTRVQWGGLEWSAAICGGQSHVIAWLKQEILPNEDASWRLLFDAARAGDLDLVQWLLVRNESAVDAAVRGALKGCQWHVVKWFTTHYKGAALVDCIPKDVTVEFLQWLLANGLADSFYGLLPVAAASGQLDVLKWLYDDVGERELTTDCLDQAASAGHLDVVQWLSSHHCPATNLAMDGAATAGFLNVVQWLHEHRIEGCSVSAMDGAAENGHLEVVKWLHTMRKEGCSVSAIEKAAGNGHLEVVQWLPSNRLEGCTTRAMDWAAKGGHQEVVKWLHMNRSEGCTTDAMDLAASSGHLKTMQWLDENRSEGCTIKAVRMAAGGGHLDVLKWLHVAKGQQLTSDAVDMAAAGGHLNVLEWLHDNGAEACSPSAMQDAVLECHVPVMLFLYNNYGHDVCEQGICLVRDQWDDIKLRFAGAAKWLFEKFWSELEGAVFVVDRADWATNNWMKDHNMQQLEAEDKVVYWE
ncbi:hypothetical protein V7S43_010953 [Phytophthora oleae]|uniref:Uncharacterized protein n=1 Tax=Phytophthora oleae TaxID=2107226 RepID=A0ABD3FCN9_9STRA